MLEIDYYPPRKSVTGINRDCYVFGNGLEIEAHVYATIKTPSNRYKSPRLSFNQRAGGNSVVRIHFLPNSSKQERVSKPDDSLDMSEKLKLGLDAMWGLLSLANALQHGHISIAQQYENYYLYADTNLRLASLLRQRCGFNGKPGNGVAWIAKNEFLSEQNIDLMFSSIETLNQLSNNY